MSSELMYVGDDVTEIVGEDEIIGEDEFSGDESQALSEILGADRRGGARRRQPGRGQVLVRKRSPDNVYTEPLPLPETVVAAGASADIQLNPVRTIRIEQLAFFGANDFVVTNFLVDQDSLFVGPGAIPAGLLTADSRIRFKSKTAGRGSTVVISVKNTGAAQATLRGVIVGTVIR